MLFKFKKMPVISDEVFNYLMNNMFLTFNKNNLAPKSIIKVIENESEGKTIQIKKLDEISIEYYCILQDRLAEKVKELKTRVKEGIKNYNELIKDGIKVKNEEECETHEEYTLKNTARFLITQFPHMQKSIMTSKMIKEETDAEKLERLKQEMRFNSVVIKSTKISEIIKDSNYYKWREIIRLTNLTNKRKERSRKSKINNKPNIILDVISYESVNEESVAKLPICQLEIVRYEKRYIDASVNILSMCQLEIVGNKEEFINTNVDKLPICQLEIIENEEGNIDTNVSEIANLEIIKIDPEKESDLLNFVTWEQFYYADKCIHKADILKELIRKDWENIENVYISLQNAEYDNKELSNRE